MDDAEPIVLNDDVLAVVRQTLVNIIGCQFDDIYPGIIITTGLDADQERLLEIVVALEERYKIDLQGHDDITADVTVGTLTRVIDELCLAAA